MIFSRHRSAVPSARALLLRRGGHDPVDGAEAFGPEPEEGTVLEGRWTLEERTARTRATVTYKARDRNGRRALVRVVRPVLEDPAGLAFAATLLLHDHADRALAVDHPNVVRLLGRGSDMAWEYVVEEAVEGHDARALRANRRGGRFFVGEVVEVGLAALSALDAAHRVGAVHGGLRPASLILCDGRLWKVQGLGLAALAYLDLDGRGLVDRAARYAAPEVITAAAYSPGADLYALAGALWTLGEGSSPFGPSIPEAVRGNLSHPVPSPQVLPREVAAVLARALEKDPADRWASASDMWAALDEAAPSGEAARASRRPA
ncbi:MAG: protein kinase domain-containing protein [Myxococcota bacterium]